MADVPCYVIQHHLATADHYDLRLEIDGVLVSWAVPKGPSTDPGVRRMAKRTGDHALDYARYEGVLGPRRHGGTVQVWDLGMFRNVSHDGSGHALDAGTALSRGHLSVVLMGHKLRGGYSLIRTRGEDLWLLLKKNDADADAYRDVTGTDTTSVLTGRTLDEITADDTPGADA